MKAFIALTQLSLATMLLTCLAVPQAIAQSISASERAALQEINRDFDEAARNLARALSDPAFRKLLWREVQASRDREKILDLKAMLTVEQSQVVEAIKEKMRAAQYLEELVGVNLYFPVKSHRQQWRGDEELLVAFDPVQDEAEMTSIIAYSVKTGEQILLDPNEAPSVPTLVIAAKERPTSQPNAPIESPSQPSQQGDLESSTEGSLWIRCLTIHDTHEPWIKGDPEIYVLVGQAYIGAEELDVQQKWLNSGTYDVNEKDKRYCFGDNSSNPLRVYFDENYLPITHFQFWESDGGGPRNIPITVEYGGVKVGTSFEIDKGDDSLGSVNVDKNAFFCGQGQRDRDSEGDLIIVSTGDVDFWPRVLIASDPCPPPIVP